MSVYKLLIKSDVTTDVSLALVIIDLTNTKSDSSGFPLNFGYIFPLIDVRPSVLYLGNSIHLLSGSDPTL